MAKLKNIQWIFFDIGSTLVDESAAYVQVVKDTLAGTDISCQEFTKLMTKFYLEGLPGDKLAAEYFGLTCAPWPSEKEFVYPDTAAVLSSLRAHFKLGIIANQKPGLVTRLEQRDLLKYFDLILSSAEEVVQKPNPEIFIRALQRADCRAEQALMIGDRIDNDIKPAKFLGMKTIWIRQGYGGKVEPKSLDEQPDDRVDSLSEILKLLEI